MIHIITSDKDLFLIAYQLIDYYQDCDVYVIKTDSHHLYATTQLHSGNVCFFVGLIFGVARLKLRVFVLAK